VGDLKNRLAALEEQNRELQEENRKLRGILVRRRRRQRPGGNGQSSGRIFGYARACTGKEEKSVEMQEEMIRERAAKLEGQLVKVYCDLVISARDIRWEKREGFRALIDAIGPGDHLIVWRLETIERNPIAILEPMRWLVNRGVRVRVLEYGEASLDLEGSTGRMVVMLWAVYARFFIDYPSTVTKQAVQWRRERGLPYNKVEMGKRRISKMVPDPQQPGKMKRQGFESWDAEECDTVREIWRRHELEHETLYSIAKDLKARGVRRWNGTPWVPDACRRRPGIKPYPLNARTVQRAFWRYTAMLAVGEDLQDLPANPEHVKIARARIHEHRMAWSRKGRLGRLPKEVRGAIERNDREGLVELTPRSWAKRLYCGPGQ